MTASNSRRSSPRTSTNGGHIKSSFSCSCSCRTLGSRSRLVTRFEGGPSAQPAALVLLAPVEMTPVETPPVEIAPTGTMLVTAFRVLHVDA